jgi:hypothetical protein
MKTRSYATLLLALLVGSIATAALAQPRPPPGGGPPPEAFAACVGRSKGEACSVNFGGREIKGSCEAPPPDAKDTRLACRPSDMPPPR